MSSPGPSALQQLRHLDKSSPNFHEEFRNVLYGKEYARCVSTLQDNDLLWLVDYLDNELDGLDPSTPAFRKCLRELRSICGSKAVLPTSCTISTDRLTIGSNPFTAGGFGDVYKGTLDGTEVCVKCVRVYTKDLANAKIFYQEAAVWKHLAHPNVLPLLGITINPFQLISNWMPGGNLPEYIGKHPDADRLGLLSDIAQGLYYLHSREVIHGDLKGPNILVEIVGKSVRARIADFGFASITKNPDSIQQSVSLHGYTPRWTAPEVLTRGEHSKKADVFSFAMVTIEIFSGATPFIGLNSFMAMLVITQGKRPPRPTHPTFRDNLWRLTQQCWNGDPRLRPEVSEALKVLLTPDEPAWKRLIDHTLATHKRISLITTIFLDRDQVNMVRNLSGDDAQSFIDTINAVFDYLAPKIRRRCLRTLYRICGRQTMVPRSSEILIYYDQAETPRYHDGISKVWKGKCNNQEAAVKVLEISPTLRDRERIRRRFCRMVVAWKALRHPNLLPLLGVTITKNQLTVASEWMVGGTIQQFTEANTNVDRLGLLGDVARGLVYMHDQEIIHGNLNGSNILIGNDGRARLTGFGLLRLVSDRSAMTGGETSWMSPELINVSGPRSHPSKGSDCYALGMVIYEVLSGQPPFSQLGPVDIIRKVQSGGRPTRPHGEKGKLFTARIWGMLEHCWKPQPWDRPSAKVVLLGIEGKSSPSRPHSMDVDMETDTDYVSDVIAGDSCMFSPSLSRLILNRPCPTLEPPTPHGNNGPVHKRPSRMAKFPGVIRSKAGMVRVPRQTLYIYMYSSMFLFRWLIIARRTVPQAA